MRVQSTIAEYNITVGAQACIEYIVGRSGDQPTRTVPDKQLALIRELAKEEYTLVSNPYTSEPDSLAICPRFSGVRGKYGLSTISLGWDPCICLLAPGPELERLSAAFNIPAKGEQPVSLLCGEKNSAMPMRSFSGCMEQGFTHLPL